MSDQKLDEKIVKLEKIIEELKIVMTDLCQRRVISKGEAYTRAQRIWEKLE